MIFLIQPKVQYAILFRLIFFFIRGVTSQLKIDLDEYDPRNPNPVDVGQDVIFNGTVEFSSPPYGVICKLNIAGPPSRDIEICDLDVDDCNGPNNVTCNCVSQVNDTYNFVIRDPAKKERSEALLHCEVGGIESQRRTYPVIQKPSTTGPTTTTETTPDDGCCDSIWIIVGSVGGFVVIAFVVILIYVCWWKKKKCAAVTSDQPSDSPAEEASTVHSTNHNTLTSSKPEDKDKVEMTEEKKKKKSKKSTKARSPKKKKKDFENGEKKMDENEPRCLPQPEPVAEPGLSTSLSNPEALKSNFATTRLSSPPSNTRPTSIEMTSAPRPLPSPRNPNM